MTIECTCIKKSFLHVSGCPVVKQRTKLALFSLADKAFAKPDGIFFYVATTDAAALAQQVRFRSGLTEEQWLYQVQDGIVSTLTLANGSEITFLPESEALNLLELPTSTWIYLENSPACRDIADVITPQTGGITFINSETKEIL